MIGFFICWQCCCLLPLPGCPAIGRIRPPSSLTLTLSLLCAGGTLSPATSLSLCRFLAREATDQGQARRRDLFL